MAKEIFRKKNLDKVNSPEDLNSYLRVTSPSLIIALAAVVVLIIGAVLWGTLQRIETKVSGAVYLTNCYVNDTDAESVILNKSTIRLDNKQYKITEKGERIDYTYLPEEVKQQKVFAEGTFVVRLTIETSIKAAYPCDVIIKSVSPFQFLFNQ